MSGPSIAQSKINIFLIKEDDFRHSYCMDESKKLGGRQVRHGGRICGRRQKLLVLILQGVLRDSYIGLRLEKQKETKPWSASNRDFGLALSSSFDVNDRR